MIASTAIAATADAVYTRFIATPVSAAPKMMAPVDLNDAPSAKVPGNEAVAHSLFKRHEQGWCEHEEAVVVSRRAGAMLEGKRHNLRLDGGG